MIYRMKSDIALNQEYTFYGVVETPASIAGRHIIINYSPNDGISFNWIIDDNDPVDAMKKFAGDKAPTLGSISGIMTSKGRFLLIDCAYRTGSGSISGPRHEKWTADIGLFGNYDDLCGNTRYTTVRIIPNGLNELFPRTHIESPDIAASTKPFSIEIEPPEVRSARSKNIGASIKLTFNPYYSIDFTSVKYSSDRAIDIDYDSPVSHESILNHSFRMTSLLSLLAGHVLINQSIACRPVDGDAPIYLLFHNTYKNDPPDLYITHRSLQDSPTLFLNHANTWSMYFDNVVESTSSWMTHAHRQIHDPLALFTDTIRAIEGFTRRTGDKCIIAESEFQDWLHRILTEIDRNTPKELVERAKSSLRYINEPTLRKRLRECIDSIPGFNESILDEKKKSFIDIAVNMRNTVAHELPLDGHDEMTHFLQQRDLGCVLHELLRFLLLKYAGIGDDILERATCSDKLMYRYAHKLRF